MRFNTFVANALVLAVSSTVHAWDPFASGGVGFALDNGDTNGDQVRDLSDPIYTLSHIFLGGPAPVPLAYCGDSPAGVQNGDTNGDGRLDISDPIGLLDWMYTGAQEPVLACGDLSGKDAQGYVRVAPPNSKAYGKTLAEWIEAYWRSYYSGSDGQFRPQFLGIPEGELLSGDFTPDDPAYLQGEIDIDLPAGTPFVLPQFAWIAETYDPALGIPDDPCIDDDVLIASVSPLEFTIDGVTIINDDNKANFYIPCTEFDPPLLYPAPSDYGSIGAVSFQGTGVVSPPLPPGQHVIHLYEEYIIRDFMGFSFGVIYDNTWNLNVSAQSP